MSLPTLHNGQCVIVLDLEMNDIFEMFGYYIDPKYTGYSIHESVWKKIIHEFERRGLQKIQQMLYTNMLKLQGHVKLQLEIPNDCI